MAELEMEVARLKLALAELQKSLNTDTNNTLTKGQEKNPKVAGPLADPTRIAVGMKMAEVEAALKARDWETRSRDKSKRLVGEQAVSFEHWWFPGGGHLAFRDELLTDVDGIDEYYRVR